MRKTVSTGHKQDGTFAIATAKWYPCPMNNMFARVTHSHICAKMPYLEHRDSPGSLHDFVLSPIGAFYVPLDPYNPEQVLGQFGTDFTNASSDSKLQSWQCFSNTVQSVCPLSSIRREIDNSICQLCIRCPEFTTLPSAYPTPYIVSSSFVKQHLTRLQRSKPDSTHFPGGDARIKVTHQSTLLKYFRPAS